MLKFKKQKQPGYNYTRSRTYRLLLIIVFTLCVGIAATGYQVLYSNDENFPLVTTVVELLLLGVILLAVVELFDNLKKEEEYLEAKTVFVSVASHDLRSPLTGISWGAEALAGEIQDPKQKARIQAIAQSSKAMLQTVDDALSITSLERLAKQAINATQTDLLELIDGVVNSLKLTADQKGVTVARTGQWPSSYPISVDEKQFRRVIANIISNEIKFASPGSTVPLTFLQDQDKYAIAFHNEGSPISVEDQKRMFELHGRTKESERSGTQGVGFGLYLAQQIVLKHGGLITVESAPDKGTTFTIKMPK